MWLPGCHKAHLSHASAALRLRADVHISQVLHVKPIACMMTATASMSCTHTHIRNAGHESEMLLVLHLVIVYPLYESQSGHFGLYASNLAVTALCTVATSAQDAVLTRLVSGLLHALQSKDRITDLQKTESPLDADVVGRHLQQATNANGAYVQVQIAILTSGNMATSLQLQLMADVAGPLLNALQVNGLAVTSITLDSLDVQEVCVWLCLFACIVNCSCAYSHCNGDSPSIIPTQLLSAAVHSLTLTLLTAVSKRLTRLLQSYQATLLHGTVCSVR